MDTELSTPCFICQKHRHEVALPPGGFIYGDAYWKLSHAPLTMAVPGQLFLESTRHFLDFAAMTEAEAATYGVLLTKVYLALKAITGAERIYALFWVETVPHFHLWLIPRYGSVPGMDYLAQEHTCALDDALAVVVSLREALSSGSTG